MFGVARAAPRQFDVLVDHRDDGVVGNTTLARTVVIQHVTRPWPALLHALPREKRSRKLPGGMLNVCSNTPEALMGEA